MGEWRYSSTILYLGTGFRRVVSVTPLSFYPRGKSPWYPLDRRLGGPQSWTGHCWVKKKTYLSPESNPGRSTMTTEPCSSQCTLFWVLSIFFSLALQPQFVPWPTSMKLFVSLRFSRSYAVGRTPWAGDQLVARPLHVHKHRKRYTHTHKH
jgi:hypothetical protein